MGDSTPKYNLRYPEGTDDIDAQQIQDLAQDVESTIASRTEISSTHAVNLTNGWSNNPSNPLTVELIGHIVYMRGEVYHAGSAPGSTEVVGNIPAAFRPTYERVRFVSKATTASNDAQVTIWSDGRVEISNASQRDSTPGYSMQITYARGS